MKRTVSTFEEWREVYKQGHFVYVLKFVKTFLRDFIFAALVMLGLIKFGVIKAYDVHVLLGIAAIFIALGAALGELSWFLLKQRFGVPED